MPSRYARGTVHLRKASHPDLILSCTSSENAIERGHQLSTEMSTYPAPQPALARHAPPPRHVVHRDANVASINIEQWEVKAEKRPIMSIKEVEAYVWLFVRRGIALMVRGGLLRVMAAGHPEGTYGRWSSLEHSRGSEAHRCSLQ